MVGTGPGLFSQRFKANIWVAIASQGKINPYFLKMTRSVLAQLIKRSTSKCFGIFVCQNN